MLYEMSGAKCRSFVPLIVVAFPLHKGQRGIIPWSVGVDPRFAPTIFDTCPSDCSQGWAPLAGKV